MHREHADFLDCCRIERPLARLICSAYECDIGACITFLVREGRELPKGCRRAIEST
jgi:hypothetical protein